MKKEKKIYLEIMRILAALSVIFNHTGTSGFFLYARYAAGSARFWSYLFCSVFCKFSVPLFFSISGALLIPKYDESIADLWKKRILKMFCVLAAVSVLYGIVLPALVGNFIYSPLEFVAAFFQASVKGHLWYLYSYIAFLMCLPFLRAMCRNLENQHFKYLIGISIVINSLPIVEYFFFGNSFKFYRSVFPTWMNANIVLYPLIGYYMEERIDIHETKKWLLPLWGVNLFLILLSGYATMVQGIETGSFNEDISQTFYNNFVLVNEMAIYLTIKYALTRIRLSPRMTAILKTVGECTFGIYLLHVAVMRIVYPGILQRFNNFLMIGIWIYTLEIAAISFAATYVLRKIPGIRMLLGG